MKISTGCSFACFFATLSITASSVMGGVSYALKVVTSYVGGGPGDLVAGPWGAPDTGSARFTNVGPSTLNGTFTLQGTSGNGGYYETKITRSVAPGAVLGSLSLTNESSNNGGFNKVAGGPDRGIEIRFDGTASNGSETTEIHISVYDGDVHSTNPRTNPFGISTDAYVLQGGDPYGRDTGDNYEESQSSGQYTWAIIDADGDGVSDDIDNCVNIANPSQADCNNDGIGDACEIASGAAQDCNKNGIPDSCDIASGSIDINSDGIPDTCQGLDQINTTTSSLGIPTANIAASTTFTGLQPTVTDAVLIIRAKGDFDAGLAGYEFLTVKLNDVTYKRVFGNGAVNCSSAVNGGVNTAVITIPIAQFDAYAAAGTLKVTLLPAPSVTASDCPDGFMTVELQFISLNASGDCDSNSLWDLGEIQANSALDHNLNHTLDTCDIRNNPALDRNNNGQLDSWDIAQDASLDRNNNGQLDSWDISQDASLDHNNNGVLDTWEISQDASLDHNNNGVLDTWEISQDASLDRNNNGQLDSWDISQDASLDRNNNGQLDSWDISQDASLDHNNNGQLDSWDISQDASLDRNNNGQLDSWEISQDASLD
ncbi:MAG: hypothetical protein WCQ44_09080, partial [Opitutaceae bacterium]